MTYNFNGSLAQPDESTVITQQTKNGYRDSSGQDEENDATDVLPIVPEIPII